MGIDYLIESDSATIYTDQPHYQMLPGDAFLHHFSRSTCQDFLAKVNAALRPGGRVVVLEFVPNADRVSPPFPARFSLTMLAETPAGDAYTLAELQQQLEGAGFRNISAHGLPTPQTVVVAEK